jgi:hypothetical protein
VIESIRSRSRHGDHGQALRFSGSRTRVPGESIQRDLRSVRRVQSGADGGLSSLPLEGSLSLS